MERPRAPRPRRLRYALLLACLVVGGVSPRFVSRPRIPDGDAPTAGTPVRHARIIASAFDGLCALTTTRGGASQVVCAEVDETSDSIDQRLVSRAWVSPPLVQLVPQAVRFVASDRFESEPSALGLLAGGGVVRFDHGEWLALPYALPPTGTHGAIVSITRNTSISATGCFASGPSHGQTLARTRDGAVLGTVVERGHVDDVWTELLPASEGAIGDFTWIRGLACVLTRRGARCAQPPATVHASRDLNLRDLAIDAPDLAGLAAAGPWLCAHDRAGALRCALAGDVGPRWTPGVVRGAPARVDAVVGSPTDLCVRTPPARWSCVAGPSADLPVDLSEAPLSLRVAPLLDGAAEIALASDGGCARWPDGAARCWGRHRRGGSFERRGPTEIRGLRDVTAITATHYGTCALTHGEVWCWGAIGREHHWPVGAARPERVPLPGAARALASRHRIFAAVGGTVFAWDEGDARVTALANPPDDRAPIASLAAVEEAVCALRVDGRVTCWREEWHEPDDDADERREQRVDVPSRVRQLEGRAHFGKVRDGVCSWEPSRGGMCWEPWHDDDGTRTTRTHRVRPRDVEDPVRVEGDCAVYSDGDRRCVHDEEEQPPLIPPSLRPPWTIDPSSEDGVRESVADARCLVLPGGRLACNGEDDRNSAVLRNMRVPFPGLMPGLFDVRAFVLGNPESRSFERGHGCALRGDGRVLCWGANHGESLSIDDAERAPRLVPLLR